MYRYYHPDRPKKLKHFVASGRRNLAPAGEFWALRNLNLTVEAGQMVGVIGHNGAGKSTLLRLVGGVGRPNEGRIVTHGRIGALLDLGVYPISFASMAFGGPPQSVASSVTLSETGVDERFSALFEYEGGGCAALSAGFGGHFEDQIVLQGTQGQIRIPRFEGWNMDRLFVDTPGAVEEIREPMVGKGYGYQAAEILRCLEVRELESPIMPLDESLAIMKTLDNLRTQWGMAFPGE